MKKIRKFSYDYEDDIHTEPYRYHFIGTKEEFDQMRQNEEKWYGSVHYNIEESDPTEEEIKNYKEEQAYYA